MLDRESECFVFLPKDTAVDKYAKGIVLQHKYKHYVNDGVLVFLC